MKYVRKVLIADGSTLAATLAAAAAIVVAAVGVFGALLGGRQARSQIRDERRAKWKEYKRSVYKDFLDAIDELHKASADQGTEAGRVGSRKWRSRPPGGRPASANPGPDRAALPAEYRSLYHKTILA